MRFRHKSSEPGTEDDSLHPDLYACEPEHLKAAFAGSGLINNNKLEFKRINFLHNDTLEIEDSKGRRWNLTVYYDKELNTQLAMIFNDKIRSIKKLESGRSEYYFATVKMDDNNYEDFVVLDKYFIVGGDNYDLQIFRIQ